MLLSRNMPCFVLLSVTTEIYSAQDAKNHMITAVVRENPCRAALMLWSTTAVVNCTHFLPCALLVNLSLYFTNWGGSTIGHIGVSCGVRCLVQVMWWGGWSLTSTDTRQSWRSRGFREVITLILVVLFLKNLVLYYYIILLLLSFYWSLEALFKLCVSQNAILHILSFDSSVICPTKVYFIGTYDQAMLERYRRAGLF